MLINKDYANIFLEYLEKTKKTRSTIIAYKKDVFQLIDYLGKKNISNFIKVNVTHLQECLDEITTKYDYSPKTISRKINSLRTFFRFLIEVQHLQITPNPSLLLKHPKIALSLPRILSKMEYMAVRDASRVEIRLYTMVEVILQTGLRIGELQRLRTQDIMVSSSGQNYLRIQSFGSHALRSVPLNDSAYQALQIYLKMRPDTNLTQTDNIFITRTAHPIPTRNIRTSIARAFRIADIKGATVNDLRNTFIAHHLAKGKSLLVIARIVGHKRITTTEKYLQALKKEKPVKATLEKL